MPNSNLSFALLLALLAWVPTWSQNADMTNEPTSGDLLTVQILRGQRSVGSGSILPPRLRDLLPQGIPGDTFQRYLTAYYWPLVDTLTQGWEILPAHGRRRAIASVRDSVLALRIDGSASLRGGVLVGEGTSPLGTGRLSMRVLGQIDTHWSFLLDLANGVLLQGIPERIAPTDPDMARSRRLFLDDRRFYDRALGAVQYEGALGRIRFGRDVVGWGYSPLGGGLLLSVPSPPLDHLLFDLHYGALRFSYLHGSAIGSDASGNDVPTKFIAAHRLQVDPLPQLSLAISDAIVYSGRGFDLSYLNPLGFYVSSGMRSAERNERDNSLLAAEICWRPLEGMLLYGTLLADDIGFSTLADTSWRGNNNKYAWQLGSTQLLHAAEIPLIAAAEYVRINPFVYSHRTVVNAWTSQGEVLGALQQPNSDRWTLALTLLLAPRMRLALRADYTRWGENWLDSTGQIRTVLLPRSTNAVRVGNVGGDAADGDGDVLPEPFAVGNRFLRGNVSHTRRLQAWVSLEPIINVFFDIRAEYLLRTGGNSPMERWWWWVQLRVGY